jgi:putative addiction module CopG family antidote
MTRSTPLPPHLERFVREQIASGRFHSEDGVIRAALQLLEAASRPGTASEPRAATDLSRRPERTALTEKWESPREWRSVPPATETAPAPARRSPRGLLADVRSGLSFDDFREARGEMWAGLRHGGA